VYILTDAQNVSFTSFSDKQQPLEHPHRQEPTNLKLKHC